MWNRNNPLAFSDPSGYEGWCDGCQGLLPSGVPQPSSKPVVIATGYAKVQITIGPFTFAMTFIPHHTYAAGGLSVSKAALKGLITAEFAAGISPMAGVIFTSIGTKASAVVTGPSGGASLGDGLGVEAWGNLNGVALGAGFITPGLNILEGTDGVKMPSAARKPASREKH